MPGYAGGTADTDIMRLRRMVNEVGSGTYTDSDLATAISRYPLADVASEWPYLTTGSANTDWTPTYDLAHAAAEIWEEKAGTVSGYFDFSADGARFDKSQVYDHYTKQARKWKSRRALGVHTMVQYPPLDTADEWLGNLPEDDD